MFPPNIVEDALEAEQLWAGLLAQTTLQTIRKCANGFAHVECLRCAIAIPLAGWKKRKSAEDGQPITPDGLQRYTSTAVKRKSLELGFVRPIEQSPPPTQYRFHIHTDSAYHIAPVHRSAKIQSAGRMVRS